MIRNEELEYAIQSHWDLDEKARIREWGITTICEPEELPQL